MRLDKWLKVSGLIPRRTVAAQACDAGKVLAGGKVAKAATEVHEGDQIEFDLGRGTVRVAVVEVPTG